MLEELENADGYQLVYKTTYAKVFFRCLILQAFHEVRDVGLSGPTLSSSWTFTWQIFPVLLGCWDRGVSEVFDRTQAGTYLTSSDTRMSINLPYGPDILANLQLSE